MIYRSEYIYERIKDGPEIHGEEEFLKLLEAETNPITEEMLLPAFSELRLGLGQNFKLDHICFLFFHGFSRYPVDNISDLIKFISVYGIFNIKICCRF